MVLTSSQMLAAEREVIEGGVTAAELMEEAAAGIWEVVRQFCPEPGVAILYLGKGNNAGDSLVVARHLHAAGWKLAARFVAPAAEFKELPARHWQALEGKVRVLPDGAALAHERGPLLILDGIMGTGATPSPLRGAYAEAVREMNALRRARHAFTVAIDLPTGLGAGDLAVEADLTVTIGHVKTPLIADDAAASVGRLAIVPLKALDGARGDDSQRVLTPQCLLPALPCRSF
jgi:NAD(P)H-hydrate epimerase